MNFKDRWELNEAGEKVLFTVEMQRRLKDAGLPIEFAHLVELDGSVAQSAPRSQWREENGRSVEDKPKPKEPRKEKPRRESRTDSFEGPASIQIDPQTGKYIGRLKWYNLKKGFGFIVRGAGEEIFFHKSGLAGDPRDMKEGQWILYDLEETRKGPEATEVELYSGDVDELA